MRIFMTALLAAAVTAGAAPAADAVIPDRLGESKVGEWVLMREVSGADAGAETRFSVAEIRGEGEGRILVVKRERYGPEGNVTETGDMEIPLARYRARLAEMGDRAKQISRERLMVKDQEITVYAVTWDDDSGREIKLWVSGEMPIGGIVKSWSSDPDFPAAEIVDYGF